MRSVMRNRKIPIPEEVKEHFKNAKEVRSVTSDKVRIIDIGTLDFREYETLHFKYAYYLNGITVWTEKHGFGEIVSQREL